MNIITDILPESVEVNGKNYPIKTDFKVWLKFHSVMCDKEKSPAERATNAILCCFDGEKDKRLPERLEDAVYALLRFYSKGADGKSGKGASKAEKVFDFTEDSDYIYAAFFEQYGIDLAKCSMHWYRFLALLNGLSENTQLRKIIAWRSVNLSEIKDDKKREFYRKMKNIYGLKSGAGAFSEMDMANELSKAF